MSVWEETLRYFGGIETPTLATQYYRNVRTKTLRNKELRTFMNRDRSRDSGMIRCDEFIHELIIDVSDVCQSFTVFFKDAWERVLKGRKGQAWIGGWFSGTLGLMRGKSVCCFFPAAKDTYHPLLVQPQICQRLSNNPSMCNLIKEHFRQTGLLELTSWVSSSRTGANTRCTQCGALAFVTLLWSWSSSPAGLST